MGQGTVRVGAKGMLQKAAVLSPLRVPDYRRLWLAQTVSIIGDKIDQIAMSILIYRLTGSALQMGVMLAVTTLPAALFGLVAAPLVDRFDRRRTMIWADIARAVIVAAIPFVATLPGVRSDVGVGLVYCLAFLVATVSLFFEPSRLALVPDIVAKDQLMAANSLDSTTNAVAELAGIAVGATLVASAGYRIAFGLDAVSFLVSAVFILTVRHREAIRERTPLVLGALRDELVDGLRHITGHPVLNDLIRLYGVAVLGISASLTLCFVLALQGFHSVPIADAMRLALIDTAITAGLVAGGVLVGMSGSARAGAKFLAGLVAFGGLLVLAAVSGDIWLSAGILFVAGMANMWFQIPMVTLIQQTAGEHYRGRVFTLRNVLVRAVTVVGLLGAGILADGIGVSAAMVVAGGLILLVGVVGWSRPALRAA